MSRIKRSFNGDGRQLDFAIPWPTSETAVENRAMSPVIIRRQDRCFQIETAGALPEYGDCFKYSCDEITFYFYAELLLEGNGYIIEVRGATKERLKGGTPELGRHINSIIRDIDYFLNNRELYQPEVVLGREHRPVRVVFTWQFNPWRFNN